MRFANRRVTAVDGIAEAAFLVDGDRPGAEVALVTYPVRHSSERHQMLALHARQRFWALSNQSHRPPRVVGAPGARYPRYRGTVECLVGRGLQKEFNSSL